MTNFSYLYDFVRTQVKLLGELGGVNGRARQLMINALSNSLAILRDSVTVFFRNIFINFTRRNILSLFYHLQSI